MADLTPTHSSSNMYMEDAHIGSPTPDTKLTHTYDKHKELVYGDDKTFDLEDQRNREANEEIHEVLSENAQAVKLMKTTTWINTFFLITTDILGPASAPYSVASMGYVPAALLYFVAGIIAGYGGWILMKLYVQFDDERDPIRTYGDIADHVFRFYGKRAGWYARCFVAFNQFCNLFLLVAVVLLGNVQALYQISGNSVCFLYLALGMTGLGCILGCIKQLKNLSVLSNGAIWSNIFVCCSTIGLAALYPAYTNIADAAPSSLFQSGFVPYDPVTGEGLLPVGGQAFNTLPLQSMMGGLANMIFAYGGASTFIEFMAEMKKPTDFWKAYVISLALIMFAYLGYGLTVYSLQGPYAGNPANQGITQPQWQIALNAINICTGTIAAVMYGNVGMKVTYITVFQEVFHAPHLTTRKGTMLWYGLSVCFWWGAFIFAEAIPQFSAFTGITAAATIMQFSYIYPPLFQLMMETQKDATWKEVFTRKLWLKSIDLFITLGSLVVMGLTLWGSISTLISALDQPGAPTQFGCTGP